VSQITFRPAKRFVAHSDVYPWALFHNRTSDITWEKIWGWGRRFTTFVVNLTKNRNNTIILGLYHCNVIKQIPASPCQTFHWPFGCVSWAKCFNVSAMHHGFFGTQLYHVDSRSWNETIYTHVPAAPAGSVCRWWRHDAF